MGDLTEDTVRELDESRKTVQYLRAMLAADLRERIVLTLYWMTKQPGSFPQPDGSVSIRVTQDLLAQMVYSTRETVCKVLNEMRRNAEVAMRRGFITVPPRLLKKTATLLSREGIL